MNEWMDGWRVVLSLFLSVLWVLGCCNKRGTRKEKKEKKGNRRSGGLCTFKEGTVDPCSSLVIVLSAAVPALLLLVHPSSFTPPPTPLRLTNAC